ncbi:MAG TPA: amidohydrolase family protein [Thermaerobacter sp.]
MLQPIPRRIIDFHAHFIVPGVRSDAWGRWEEEYAARFGQAKLELWRERQRRNIAARWRGLADAEDRMQTEDEAVALWKQQVDVHGLNAIVFLTGGGNDRLSRIVRQYPGRFIGFAHHDPFAPNAAEELERAVTELGLRGYKILAPVLSKPVDDPAAYPVWETAERLGIPVLIHFGILGGGGGIAGADNCNPLRLERVAQGFPGIPFVIPHFGAGYMRELLLLCWSCPNVHVDTSGSLQWMRWVPGDLTLRSVLRTFLESVGPERILFGSDSSVLPRGFIRMYYEELQRACWSLNVPEEHQDLIFYGNAARLLRLPAETARKPGENPVDAAASTAGAGAGMAAGTAAGTAAATAAGSATETPGAAVMAAAGAEGGARA